MIDFSNRQHDKLMSTEHTPLRIGAVSYLNSKPLIEGLSDLTDYAELILDVPSRLADDLGDGLLDVALIPSVEAFLDPSYEIVSDACVATHGPVLSVKLYTRVHPGEVKTLALDEGSRTSAALAQILLNERYGVRPKLQKLPLRNTTEDTDADAILLIGDRAMSAPEEKFHSTWDLGEEWVNWTGLPFVFAMWVTRRDSNLKEIPQRLCEARDQGYAEIKRIAADGASHLKLRYETTYRYLTQNLHFRLGEAEKAGLKLFQTLAVENGFAKPTPIRFRKQSSQRIEELVSG